MFLAFINFLLNYFLFKRFYSWQRSHWRLSSNFAQSSIEFVAVIEDCHQNLFNFCWSHAILLCFRDRLPTILKWWLVFLSLSSKTFKSSEIVCCLKRLSKHCRKFYDVKTNLKRNRGQRLEKGLKTAENTLVKVQGLLSLGACQALKAVVTFLVFGRVYLSESITTKNPAPQKHHHTNPKTLPSLLPAFGYFSGTIPH